MTGENLPFSPQISAYKALVRFLISEIYQKSYIRNTISEIKKWRRLHSSPCLDRRGCCLSCLVMSRPFHFVFSKGIRAFDTEKAMFEP